MIYGNISQAENYTGLGSGIRLGLEYLMSGKFSDPEAGKTDLGEGVYAMCKELETKSEGIWEAHRKYLDIHFALEEGECIACADTDKISGWSVYDAEADCMTAPGSGSGVKVEMRPGDFLIVFPEDGHMPELADGGHKKLRKIIVKIPVTR